MNYRQRGLACGVCCVLAMVMFFAYGVGQEATGRADPADPTGFEWRTSFDPGMVGSPLLGWAIPVVLIGVGLFVYLGKAKQD